MGRILKVDLAAGTLRNESISEDVARKYLCGKGYAIYILYNCLRNMNLRGSHHQT